MYQKDFQARTGPPIHEDTRARSRSAPRLDQVRQDASSCVGRNDPKRVALKEPLQRLTTLAGSRRWASPRARNFIRRASGFNFSLRN
jgi:hypothetical protein